MNAFSRSMDEMNYKMYFYRYSDNISEWDPIDEFRLERVFCQGDPLSLFLFLIAVEGFNVLMKAIVEGGMFTIYRVGYGVGVSITHLEFADDTLLMGS